MREVEFQVENMPLPSLLVKYPFLDGYFASNAIEIAADCTVTLDEYLASIDEEIIEDKAIDTAAVRSGAISYIDQMLAFLGGGESRTVESVTILPGTNKLGEAEGFEQLTIRRGEIISIVGPTGSGKSRLLADIEWMAQADTPTSRRVLIDGNEPDRKWRFSTSDKLVAQLSQNMNFVMDLSVEEFVTLHAESRMVQDVEGVVTAIIAEANALAGEQFTADTAITSLSGGQSRALMIADTAILSRSPIVLIDEIENAGIDRKKALALLLSEDKIVLMATHDPVLALMGDRRIIIAKGGIANVIETDDKERAVLCEIEEMDRKVQQMRAMLRAGERLDEFEF